jgi:tRNA(His) 5'-end guanylyltransferase
MFLIELKVEIHPEVKHDAVVTCGGGQIKPHTYRVIRSDCRGFNNLSYTLHLRYEYVVAPMD